MSIVEINHLKKYYGQHCGVEDVHFSIEEGEIFGFIGPNGAGKSTTIRCMLSLIFPTAGEIKIFGKDAIKDRVEIAKQLGYLPSEVFYYDNMRVKDMLHYSAAFYGEINQARIDDLCEILELDQRKKMDELSLGNKKKVGIIQGLLHHPKLIILDEPTSGLDPLIQQRFFDLILEERKQGATVLFSSHILSEVKRLCDRIAIIRNGVVEDISTIAALDHKNYKRVHIDAPEEELIKIDDLPDAEMEEKSEGHRQFIYRGRLQNLLQSLSGLDPSNLTIEDPPLEEIFMHYYEKERNA